VKPTLPPCVQVEVLLTPTRGLRWQRWAAYGEGGRRARALVLILARFHPLDTVAWDGLNQQSDFARWKCPLAKISASQTRLFRGRPPRQS